jgi:hypothetical protein
MVMWRPHVRRAPLHHAEPIPDGWRPRCRHQPRIAQQHKGNALTRSAPQHPIGDGVAPPSLKAAPDPCRHGWGATGEEICGHATPDKRTRVIPHKGPPALGWHTRAWPPVSVWGHVLADGARRHLQAELEPEFVGDTPLAPGEVVARRFQRI